MKLPDCAALPKRPATRAWKSLALKGISVWKATHSTDSVDSPVESTLLAVLVGQTCAWTSAPASFADGGSDPVHATTPTTTKQAAAHAALTEAGSTANDAVLKLEAAACGRFESWGIPSLRGSCVVSQDNLLAHA
jgi:hypothetical protein